MLSMNSKLLVRLGLITVAAIYRVQAAGLFALESPWPFPTRPDLPASGSSSLTVAFWNIEWFPGRRPDASPEEETRQIQAVHADIARLNADVVGMEEVRDFARAGLAVQPLSGFKVDVCANFPPREGQDIAQEVAIASRLQPLSAWAEQWNSAGPILPPRGFAFAAYNIGPRQLLMFYAMHLKSNRGEIGENIAMREESVRQLQSHVQAMEAAYGKLGTITWILGGDFNTSLEDKEFAKETTLRSMIDKGFGWVWQNTPVAGRMTLPAGRGFPARCFDHIFYRNATLRRASVVSTSPQSSDHRAIVATFELPAAAK
jgi:endonuclease/exonuclease/phosphatase (EEP) superfamily protein YafD